MPKDRRNEKRGSRAAMIVVLAFVTSGLLAPAPGLARAPGAGGPDPAGAYRTGAEPSGAEPGLRTVMLDPTSAITFHASDAFGGFDGKAPVASFSSKLDPGRPESAQGSVEVDSDAVTTGNFLRDVNAARTVFESSTYPTIRYTLTDVQADPASLHDGDTSEATVRGRLRMHGVTREVVAHGVIVRAGDELDVRLALPVRLSDFDMARPRFLTVTVDDEVEVQVHVLLRVEAAGGGG